MAHSNEARIRSANEQIIGKGNLDAVEEVFAAGYVVHAEGKDHRGTGFVRKFIKLLRSAIPDVRVVEAEILMRAGDSVAWQRTLSGTHRADLAGIPPSGKKVKWMDMHVTRFEDGKIVEEWAVSDLASQLLLKLPRA